ncbi:3-oxoacyl-(acyl-carrier-protein) reductase [Colletotrichum lupini]|uniref:3-oxoacyl-(Acyl-carrier-protein) reductase n=1 Tax=Colletotrichum lupini TaxID=145971 RepID=A0A9Q8WN13_9PEZI|nr:3-oxoacyl-(acyl-carrier-protein) reductase [Colletotrichum lupini]KAK1705829.1 3-oxoacyl-reductase [Colletotrichum lupini]UQC88625.1 3-oxoacyl-(acyl-carrier-protein) reductase [Colletotrichum lupini]
MKYTLLNPSVQEQDLAGKFAIVTGASRGLGRGIAFHLASRGSNVLATCSSETSLKNVVSLQEEIRLLYQERNPQNHATPRIFGVVAPLTEPSKCCDNIVAAVKEHFSGAVNILVQNAALQETMPIEAIDEGHVRRMLTGNISTAVQLIQALLPHFVPDSRIVNISSEGARQSQPAPVTLLYGACKAALESMTRVWADALGTRAGMERTTVNSLIVGVTKTGDTANGLPEGLPDIEPVRQLIKFKMEACSVDRRLGEVDDVAEIVGWLCCEKSRWVSGSAVCANGGTVKIL